MSQRMLELLVVEDNPADVRLIREGLKRPCADMGLNVRLAEDGEQALKMLLDDGYRPDMILLDLSLPRIDGQTVLQRVRAHGISLSATPIIVFSSSQHGIQEIIDSGANTYIVKPGSLNEYLKAIERFAILWLKPLAEKPAAKDNSAA